jgi:hypothetical protein
MADRIYRVAIAATEGGLQNAASSADGWTILWNTVSEFSELTSDDDHSLGDIGGVTVSQSGWVALAYKEAGS